MDKEKLFMVVCLTAFGLAVSVICLRGFLKMLRADQKFSFGNFMAATNDAGIIAIEVYLVFLALFVLVRLAAKAKKHLSRKIGAVL